MLAFSVPMPPQGDAPPKIDHAPRLRRVLTNGAAIGAETRPPTQSGTGRLAVCVAIAARDPDTAATYGHRHLLEHLVTSRDPDLDRKLETVGGGFGASTGRDAMRIWVTVPSGQAALAYATLRELLKPLTADEAALARERAVIGREVALLGPAERAPAAAWNALYGESGTDPMGSETALASVTGVALEREWRTMLRGPNLSFVAVGDLDLDLATDRLEALARAFPDAPRRAWADRAPVQPACRPGAGAFALAVGAVDEPATLATLGTALALAGEVDGASVSYTPAGRNGVITILNAESPSELRAVLRRGDVGLRNRSRDLARAWIAGRAGSLVAAAEIRATLALFRASLTPERLETKVGEIGIPELDAAFARWRGVAE